MHGAVVVDSAQEPADELRQLGFFHYMEDPGVIDAEVCGSEFCEKNRLPRGTHNKGKGGSLDLNKVSSHLSG